MPESQGVPGDATPEEIEEKHLWEFRQTGANGGVVSPEAAQALIKLMDDAGKGKPPDPEKEKEQAEAKEKERKEREEEGKKVAAEAKKQADEANKATEG